MRGAKVRMYFLTSAHTASIGLKSGEYGGRNFTVAPRRTISAATAGALSARRLSSNTISPGCRRGASRSRTHAVKSFALTAFHCVPNVTQPPRRTAAL